MTIKKLLTSILVLVLVLGIGIGVYVVFNLDRFVNPSTNNTTDTTDTTGGASNTVIPNHNQNAGGNLDIESALTTLFTKAGAQKVQFTSVTTNDGELGSVYALYSADIANAKTTFPKLTEFPINIALVDLNKDGSPEAIVWENLPGVCGSGGCPLEMYHKIDGVWKMFYSDLSGSVLGVSTLTTKGYANILLPSLGEVGYQSNILLYVYNGITYVPNKVVATWNGNQFTQ